MTSTARIGGRQLLPPSRKVGWIFWAVLASLPWLVPTHAQPWTAFHVDAAMIVPAALLLAYAVVTGPPRFLIPGETWVLTAVAAVPIGQLLFGLIDYAGDAWLPTLYVLSVAAAIAVGSRLQQLQPWVLPSALFGSFAIAGLVAVVLMVFQWFRLDILGTLLLALPVGSRLSANLGQPNQLATLLAWGLIALWWANLRHKLHGAAAVFLAAVMLAGIAMTQSRAGALEVLLLASAAWLFRRQLRADAYAPAVIGLCAWFALAFVAWPVANEMLRPGQVPTLEERMSGGTRMLHWSVLIDAVMARPWFGWGWNQVVHAQWEFARFHPPTHEVVQYGHNLLLDLLLWNGIPIGVVLGIALAAWYWRQFRLAVSQERVLLFLATLVFALHALFEFPHGYFVFLLPVGLIAGVLHLPVRGKSSAALDRRAVGLVAIASLFLALVIVRDYSLISDAWLAHRFRAARIANVSESLPPKVAVLSNLDALLASLGSKPRAGMEAQEIEQLRRVAKRYPSPSGLFRYAWALALNGQLADATRTLEYLCHVHVEDQCLAAKEAWFAKAEQEFPPASGAWPAQRPLSGSAQRR